VPTYLIIPKNSPAFFKILPHHCQRSNEMCSLDDRSGDLWLIYGTIAIEGNPLILAESFENRARAGPPQVPQTPGSHYRRKSRPDGAGFRLPPDAKYWTSLPVWQRICKRYD
jgi:hypothetical protein